MELLTETDTEEAVATRELVRADRCDRCGAQAYTIVTKGNLELLFCGHHGKRYEPSLIGEGWEVEFQLYLLDKKEDE